MESHIHRITFIPDLCNGKPTIRGNRITVKTILEYVAAGETEANILKAHPFLEKEDITACFEYAALTVDQGIKSIKFSA